METINLQTCGGSLEIRGDREAFIELANMAADARYRMELSGFPGIAAMYHGIWLQIERKALGYNG